MFDISILLLLWIDNFSQQRLEEAEKSATDYISLGKVLLQIIFSKVEDKCGAAPRVEGAKYWTKTSSVECEVNKLNVRVHAVDALFSLSLHPSPSPSLTKLTFSHA